MEISKKSLIITLLIDILLIAAGIACVIIMNFSTLALGLFCAVSVFVLFSSVLAYCYGKFSNQNVEEDNQNS